MDDEGGGASEGGAGGCLCLRVHVNLIFICGYEPGWVFLNLDVVYMITWMLLISCYCGCSFKFVCLIIMVQIIGAKIKLCTLQMIGAKMVCTVQINLCTPGHSTHVKLKKKLAPKHVCTVRTTPLY
jgi:hypothetical protein